MLFDFIAISEIFNINSTFNNYLTINLNFNCINFNKLIFQKSQKCIILH